MEAEYHKKCLELHELKNSKRNPEFAPDIKICVQEIAQLKDQLMKKTAAVSVLNLDYNNLKRKLMKAEVEIKKLESLEA